MKRRDLDGIKTEPLDPPRLGVEAHGDPEADPLTPQRLLKVRDYLIILHLRAVAHRL